ncbi:MAG: type II toxin-antitoxin system RelE family toxin [Acidimicrobiales bacterium]
MSEPYEVRISARAERDLLRLPEKIGAACVEFIFGALAEQPHRVGGALSGPFAGLRSARRGSYRIVYRIDDDERRVDIAHIDHRGDVYR